MPRRARRTISLPSTAVRALIALLASAGLLAVLAPSAMADACTAGTAQQKTWTGADGDGMWHNGLNWTPGGVPTNVSNVCIPAGAPAVTIGQPATVISIAAASPITLPSNLTLTGSGSESNTSSTFTMNGGTLAGAGSLRVLSGGALNWTEGGNMNGPAVGTSSTIIDPGATMTLNPGNGGTKTLNERRWLVINGAATLTGATQLYGHANSRVDVGSGGTLTLAGDQAYLVDNVGGGNTASALRVLAGGKLIQNGPAAATNTITMPIVNQGSIEAVTGSMIFSGGTHATAGTPNNGVWNSTGGVNRLTNGAFTLAGASVTGSGTGLSIEGGVVTVPTGQTLTGAPTATLAIGMNGNLTGAGTVNVSGTLTWDAGGMQQGAGVTEVLSGGQLKLIQSNPAITSQRNLTDRTVKMAAGSTGVYEGTADTWFYNGAKFEIGGTLDVRSDDYSFLDATGTGTRALRVLAGGTLKRTNGGQYATSGGNSVPLENDGTVDAAEGNFGFSGGGSGVSSGVFQASATRYTELTGGTFEASTPSLAGAGALRLVGGTLNLQSSGVLTGADVSTLSIGSNGYLTGPGTANIAGILEWDAGGAQLGTGLTEVLSGGQLKFTHSNPANGPNRVLTDRTVRMAAGSTGAYGGTADTYFYDGGKLEIGGTLDVRTDDQAFVDATGTGTRAVRVLSGGTLKRTNGAQYATSGANSVPLENDGTVDAAEGNFSFTNGGPGVSSGVFKASANQYTELAAGTWEASTPSLEGAGALRVIGGTLNLQTGGVLTGAAASTLWVGLNGALTGPGTANVSGTLQWDAGGIQLGTGLTEVKSGGQLKLTQANAANTAVRQLNGRTVRMAAGSTGVYEGKADTYFYDAGKLEIGGTLDVRTDNQAFTDATGSGTRAVRVLAGGTLKKTNGGTGLLTSADNSVPLENDGTVEAETGDLEFNNGSGVSSGTWKAAAGRYVRLNTGTYDIDGGSVEGAGRLHLFNGATLNVLSAKTLTVASGGVLHQDASTTVTGPGTVAVAGTFDWGPGSTQNGTGTTKILDGGSLVTSKSTAGLWRAHDQRRLRVEQGGVATLGRPIGTGYPQGEPGWIGQSNGARIDVAGTLEMAGPNNPQTSSSSPNLFDNGAPGGIKIEATGTLTRTLAGKNYTNVPVENAGTISVTAGALDLEQATTGWNAGTSTLNGGTFSVADTGNLILRNVNAQKLGAKVVLDGASSKFTNDGTASALAALNGINVTGGLTLRNGRNLTTAGALTNNGLVSLASSKLSVPGAFTQTATGTYAPTVSGTGTAPLAFGQLAATGKATLAGKIDAAVGAGYTPVLRDKVDTITATTGVVTPTWAETMQDPLRPRYDANAVKLIADVEPPAVTVGATTPRPLTNDASPAFAGTAGTKEGDVATVQLALFKSTAPTTDLLPANSTATVSGGNWTFSSPIPALEDGGTYTLRVRQSDDVKNVGEVTKEFTVDRVDPTPSIGATTPKPRTNVTSRTVSGTAGTAAGDDSTQVKVTLFGGPDTGGPVLVPETEVAQTAGGAFTFTDTGDSTLTEGTYTWRVTQTDAATNVGTVTKTFVVDLTPPEPEIDAGKPGARTKTNTPDFAGNAGTLGGDNGTVELDLFNGGAPTGTDRLPTATATVSDGRWTYAAAAPVLADGQYTLRVRQGDAADNEGAVTKTFVVDTKSPTPTIASPASAGQRLKTKTPMFSGTGTRAVGDKTTVDVTITGTPTGGVAITPITAAPAVNQTTGGWTYSPSPVLKDGSYTIKVKQADDVGNALELTRTFVVDNIAPNLTLADLPASPTNVNTVQASGTGGRAVGDKPSVDLTITGTPTGGAAITPITATAPVNATTGNWTYSAATTLADGTYTIKATQSDTAVGGATPGNTTTKTRTLVIDTVKPTIAANALSVTTGAGGMPIEEGATTTSKTARFSFSANEPSSYKCKLELDGAAGTLAACSSPHDVSGLADGTYKFTVVATDTAGNVQATPSERTFSVVRGVNVAAGVLSYDAGTADDAVSVRTDTVGGAPVFVVKNTEVASVPAGEGCSQLTAIEAACPAAGLTKIHVGTGAGADRVNAPVAMALELDGGPGNDRLSGGSAADTLIGGDDDDLLDGRLGGDTMTGNGGTDTVTYAQRTTPVTLSFDGVRNDGASCPGASCENDALGTSGTSDVEIVFGGQAADTISGAVGVDKLNGGPGNDKLDAKGGNDVLSGNGGDDTLIGGPGPGTPDNDVVNGGDGTDLADYSARTTTAVNVTLDDIANDGRPVSTVPAEKDDVRTDVENVTGGGVADTITGSPRENALKGGAGNDVLDGGFGADVLDGGIGTDQVDYALRLAGVTVDLSGADATREADAGNADDEAGDGRRDLVLAMEGARGGAARDLLTAGTLAGGTWAGNGGRDRIEVKNGKADTVNCGADADEVVADAAGLDTGIDTASCEVITR